MNKEILAIGCFGILALIALSIIGSIVSSVNRTMIEFMDIAADNRMLLLLLLAGLGLMIGHQLFLWRERHHEVEDREFELHRLQASRLYPDQSGYYPMEAAHGMNQDYLSWLLEHGKNQASTWRQVPNTFSPRYDTSNTTLPPFGFEEDEDSTLFQVPGIRELYYNGSLPRGDEILIGYDYENSPYNTRLRDLYSAIIAGTSGMGKTTLLRFILAQHFLKSDHGIDLYICDPHMMHEDESTVSGLLPFQEHFADNPVCEDQDILDTVRRVNDIGKNRKKHGVKNGKPTMLIIDEVSYLLDGSNVEKELKPLLKNIAREYRKFGVMAIMLGQDISGDVLSTDIRKAFSSILCVPIAKGALGRAMPKAAVAAAEEEIQKTQVVFSRVGEAHKVLTVPNCTREDIEEILRGKYANMGRNRTNSTRSGRSERNQNENNRSRTAPERTIWYVERHQNTIGTAQPEWTQIEINIIVERQNGQSYDWIYHNVIKGQKRMSKTKALTYIKEVLKLAGIE